MATIRTRTTDDGELRYEVQIRLRGAEPETQTFRKLAAAKRWAQEREVALRSRRAFGRDLTSKATVGDLIARYGREKLAQLADSARPGRERHLAVWAERIGHVPAVEVHPDMLTRVLLELEADGAAPATLNRHLSAISRVLQIAVREWRLLEINPARALSRRAEPHGRDRWLVRSELEALLTACTESVNHELAPLVMVALASGGRQGELLELDWSSVDLGRRTMRFIRTKNGERRTVPLNAPAIDALRKLGPKPTGRVFSSPFPRTAWENAMERAGIRDFRFHDLRHTAASYWAMSGASLLDLAALLGHKTLAMVKRYAHLSPDHLSAVTDRAAAAFFTPTGGGDGPGGQSATG